MVEESRVEKLEKIAAKGVDPFGSRFEGAVPIAELLSRFPSERAVDQEERFGEARAAGRVVLLRDFRGIVFLHFQDETGRMQAAVQKKALAKEEYEFFRDVVEIGDILGLSGELGFTRKGEPTLWVKEYRILCKSLRTLPEKFHGLSDVEQRYRRRCLDLIVNREAMDRAVARCRMIASTRRFLAEKGFLDVETPMMHPIPGGATAKPFVTEHNALGMRLYMRIATELYLKRLLVGGMEKVFEIGRCFRNEGLSPKHNPEFTSLELYQAYADLSEMMELTEELVTLLAEEMRPIRRCSGPPRAPVEGRGGLRVERGGETVDLSPPWRRAEFDELLREYAGVEAQDEAALRARVEEAGLELESPTRPEMLDALFGRFVEPELQNPCFVTGHPVELSPLCKPRAGDPSRAERFELIIAGMELANAYTELNDPLEQRRRLEEKAGEREGGVDEDFLFALEVGMPPAGGLGIGLDRLAMILTGAGSIRDVILFPLLRPRK